ncbi:hypothetical protein CR513_01810, partial [Mucuna pruriens]
MKERFEVEIIFINFYIMAQTQFQKTIHIVVKNISIVSCVNTPQQNGLAKRKNKHLLEVARALLFSHQLPTYLCGKAMLSSAYLTNEMPNKVLNFDTPLDILHTCFPTNILSSSFLPLKIFGCTAFVHIHNHNKRKLEPQAKKNCVCWICSKPKGI